MTLPQKKGVKSAGRSAAQLTQLRVETGGRLLTIVEFPTEGLGDFFVFFFACRLLPPTNTLTCNCFRK
jgi:hypothetical protein